jgi:UDP-N-acetylglucosamine 3-dehydrogenase
MSIYRVGIIGCGRPRNTEGATGYGMSRAHAAGYVASPDAEIVALADINLENARAFQADYGGEHLYADYREMLAQENLDIVSISTWPALHCEMVCAAAEAGVRAIHCEKPMAPSYGEAKRMVAICEEHGVQLTFNHQRRFGAPYRRAKELLDSGAIGDLQRLEAHCGDIFDWGTHWVDMMFKYNNETPAEWVIGQVEPTGGRTVFGVPLEGQAISYWRFRNGVYGILVTGALSKWSSSNRLVGTEGTIEVGVSPEISLRYWGRGHDCWQVERLDEGLHGAEYVKRGVLDLIDALKTGREPELAARRALRATEVIFATYESSRRRGRVDLPLDTEDSPFQAL